MPKKRVPRITHLTREKHGHDAEWVRFFARKGPGEKQVMVAQRSFAVSSYGSRRAALAAAIAFRDKTARKLGVDPVYRTRALRKCTKRSASGVAGVYLQVRRSRRRGVTALVAGWCVSGVDAEGRPFTTSFAIRRYGYLQAFVFALRRRAQVAGTQVPERLLLPPPNAKQRSLLVGAGVVVPRVRFVRWREDAV